MYVNYVPSKTRKGLYCRIDGSYAPMTCMISPTISQDIAEVVSGQTRVLSPTTLHRDGDVWRDTSYERRIYVQTFTPFVVWPNWYSRWEEGRGLSSASLQQLVNVGLSNYSAKFNNLQSKAETEARLKLAQSDVNLGAALGELRETISHLSDTAERLFRWMKWAKQSKWSSIRRDIGLKRPGTRHGGTLSQNWLEYQFAWLPLMGDVFGTWSEAQKAMLSKAMVVNVTRKVSDSGTLVFNSSTATAPYNVMSIPFELGVTCHLQANLSSPGLNRLAALGLINPLAIAWELMPFSFVIDWAIPVGSVLEALTSTIGCTFRTGSLTRRVSVDASQLPGYSFSAVYAPKGYETVGRADIKGVHVIRQVYGSFPMPSWYSNTNLVTSNRALSSIALALQHLRQLRRTR